MTVEPLLVRHPGPYRNESFFGYILRLSETNGYASPSSLFQLAQMKPWETQTASMRVEKLAKITGRPVKELERVAYFHERGVRHARLLSHEILSTHLVLRQPHFCPECVAERGYIEAHWDLAFMTACPVHKKSVLSSCPSCHARLRWFRPGLLECSCVANLRDCDLPAISASQADLLGIIRQKVLGLEAEFVSEAAQLQKELSRLSLRGLLTLVRKVGCSTFVRGERPNPKEQDRIVARFADHLGRFC